MAYDPCGRSLFNKVLTSSQGGDTRPHVDIPRIIRLVQDGRLSFDGIITHEVPLGEISPALDLMRSGKAVELSASEGIFCYAVKCAQRQSRAVLLYVEAA